MFRKAWRFAAKMRRICHRRSCRSSAAGSPRSRSPEVHMRRLIHAIALIVFASIALAQSQPFPSRTVTIVSPFPPGGSTDAVARVMAQRMAQTLGQSVVVENVGGAGGSIGAGRVARAAPDGYTI